MFRYSAFGVTIESSIEFPGAWGNAPSAAAPDVVVGLSDAAERTDGASRSLSWSGVGKLVATDGRRLTIHPAAGAEPSALSVAAAGAGLGMLLEQRGFLVLHGSCVQIGAGAACFVGASGVGKSSVASALVGRGHRLVSDAMTVVSFDSHGATAHFGPPQLKLWPDALKRLSAPLGVETVFDSEKLLCAVQAASTEGTVRLERIYSLAASEVVTIGNALRPAEAVMQLMRNVYLADYLDASSAPILLQRCVHAVEATRSFRADRGSTPSDLEHFVALLEHDAQAR